MSQVWGQTLKHLRQQGDPALYILCSAHIRVDFSKSEIWLTCQDEASYELLRKNKKTLESIAGEDVINITKHRKEKRTNKKTQKIKELLGDKLRVE